MKALIIDGQNNHDWRGTTPILKQILENTGLFTVDVATTRPHGQDMSSFHPNFEAYKVIVSNYNGDSWPPAVKTAFVDYIRQGGGLVVVHAADNAFPAWKEYNEMIGIGGWNGRNEKSGPYVYWQNGHVVLDHRPGPGGHHGRQHPFLVVTRDVNHPIMRGLPTRWLHVQDELYDQMRGPAVHMTVLATAYADPKMGGAGHDEPMLMALHFGKGRIFHTTLGHGVEQMEGVGFIVTLQRGAEWAATGKVTQKVPADFPTAEQTRSRQLR